jgi:hypothetical protein
MLCKNRQSNQEKLSALLNFDINCFLFDDINSFIFDDIVPVLTTHDIILKMHFRHYYSHPFKHPNFYIAHFINLHV